MDGMLHLATEAAGGRRLSNLLGILYAEDFDEPQTGAPEVPAAPEPEAPPPLAQSDIDAACAHAVATARLEWEASAAEKRLDLLAATRSAIADAHADAADIAHEIADATVGTILAILMSALPDLCAGHGPNEVRALLARLLPLLRAEPKITIRVHADLVSPLRQDLTDLQADHPGTLTVTAAPIARGDVRVAWENGSLVRDTDEIHQAMHEALDQLGLLGRVDTSAKRSFAHAE